MPHGMSGYLKISMRRLLSMLSFYLFILCTQMQSFFLPFQNQSLWLIFCFCYPSKHLFYPYRLTPETNTLADLFTF